MTTTSALPQGDVRLRARPDVAVTIDTAAAAPQVLLLRGRVTVTDVDGIAPRYAAAHRRSYGEQAARAALGEVDGPGLPMARIGRRPARVRVLDVDTRFPGGGTAEDFARRGRS